MAKRKRNKKWIKFGKAVFQAFAISVGGAALVVSLSVLSFALAPHIKVYGQPMMPLIPPVLIALFGLLGVKYVVPEFVRLRCPKCQKKALRYDCNLSLSFHCKNCGVKKYTWFHIS